MTTSTHSDAADRFAAAARFCQGHVAAIASDQWDNPTPCTEWSVRDLVNHVTGELLWAPPLLAGATLAEVGDRFAGDVVGADPAGAFDTALAAALAAFTAPDALAGQVHLSYGDDAATNYCSQMTLDQLVHGWDLARGIGRPDTMPAELVDWALSTVLPLQELLTASGLFGTPVPVAEDADPQTRLLAVLGRAR